MWNSDISVTARFRVRIVEEVIFRVVIGVIRVSRPDMNTKRIFRISRTRCATAKGMLPTNYTTHGQPHDNERLKNRDLHSREIKQAACCKLRSVMKRSFPWINVCSWAWNFFCVYLIDDTASRYYGLVNNWLFFIKLMKQLMKQSFV